MHIWLQEDSWVIGLIDENRDEAIPLQTGVITAYYRRKRSIPFVSLFPEEARIGWT